MNNSTINNIIASSGMNDDDHYGHHQQQQQQQQQQDLGPWKIIIPIPFILMFILMFVLFFIYFFIDQCLLKKYREKRQQQQQQLLLLRERAIRVGRVRMEEEKQSVVVNPMLQLNTKERQEIYKNVFNSKGNIIVLTKDHFTTRSEKKKKKKEEEEMPSTSSSSRDVSNNQEESEIFVDIELGDSSSSISSSSSSRVKKRIPPQCILTTNDGTCIICFEEFSVDDVIVWSENNDCPHVYHEGCMIDYLTTKRRPKKTIRTTTATASNNTNADETETENETEHGDNTDDTSISDGSVSSNGDDEKHRTTSSTIIMEQNPCPTCRRDFCSITLDEFNNAIIITAGTAATH
jgi:hypothetical protein